MDSMTIHPILPELEPSCNTLYYLVLGSNSERIGRIVMESIDPSIRRLARDVYAKLRKRYLFGIDTVIYSVR